MNSSAAAASPSAQRQTVVFYNPKTGRAVGNDPEPRMPLIIACINTLRDPLRDLSRLQPISDQAARDLFQQLNATQLTPEEAEIVLASDAFQFSSNCNFLKSYLKMLPVFKAHVFEGNRRLNLHHFETIGGCLLSTAFPADVEQNLRAIFDDAEARRDAAVLYPMKALKRRVPFLIEPNPCPLKSIKSKIPIC